MNESQVTKEGQANLRPGMEATVGVNVPGGPPRRRRRAQEPVFRTYYDQPVLNKPVWEAPDIPGYLFLGGLAGAGAVMAAAAELTGRHALARSTKLSVAAAGGLSLVALVHDLGRRGRFLNMLRVFKVTSPMSVGSWLLAGFVPAAGVSALCDLTDRLPVIGAAATAGAALLGPAVATYTAALISNTAVPAWHDGYREMPFVFGTSALSAAAGIGLAGAPVDQTGPLKGLGAASGALEVLLSKAMEKRMGLPGEAYHEGKAGKYMKASEVCTLAGAGMALLSGRGRTRRFVAGAALLTGSALARFGIFEAGVASSLDPKYTVVPQRQRLEERRPGPSPDARGDLVAGNGSPQAVPV